MSKQPRPLPDRDTSGFWTAARAGVLAFCRCRECRMWMHPPSDVCRECAGAVAFETVGGTATIFSAIVMHAPLVPGFENEVPYVLVLAEFDEQTHLRLTGRLADATDAANLIGRRVVAQIVAQAGSDEHVPVFRLADVL